MFIKKNTKKIYRRETRRGLHGHSATPVTNYDQCHKIRYLEESKEAYAHDECVKISRLPKNCIVLFESEGAIDDSSRLLIDTGAAVSIVKSKSVRPYLYTYCDNKIQLTGIGNNAWTTEGTVSMGLELSGGYYIHKFQMVQDELLQNIPADGILGRDFLGGKAKINSIKNTLEIKQIGLVENANIKPVDIKEYSKCEKFTSSVNKLGLQRLVVPNGTSNMSIEKRKNSFNLTRKMVASSSDSAEDSSSSEREISRAAEKSSSSESTAERTSMNLWKHRNVQQYGDKKAGSSKSIEVVDKQNIEKGLKRSKKLKLEKNKRNDENLIKDVKEIVGGIVERFELLLNKKMEDINKKHEVLNEKINENSRKLSENIDKNFEILNKKIKVNDDKCENLNKSIMVDMKEKFEILTRKQLKTMINAKMVRKHRTKMRNLEDQNRCRSYLKML